MPFEPPPLRPRSQGVANGLAGGRPPALSFFLLGGGGASRGPQRAPSLSRCETLPPPAAWLTTGQGLSPPTPLPRYPPIYPDSYLSRCMFSPFTSQSPRPLLVLSPSCPLSPARLACRPQCTLLRPDPSVVLHRRVFISLFSFFVFPSPGGPGLRSCGHVTHGPLSHSRAPPPLFAPCGRLCRRLAAGTGSCCSPCPSAARKRY